MKAVIVDNWNIFGYDGPVNPEFGNRHLVAAKYEINDYCIVKDFEKNNFVLFVNGSPVRESDYFSKLLDYADGLCKKES